MDARPVKQAPRGDGGPGGGQQRGQDGPGHQVLRGYLHPGEKTTSVADPNPNLFAGSDQIVRIRPKNVIK